MNSSDRNIQLESSRDILIYLVLRTTPLLRRSLLASSICSCNSTAAFSQLLNVKTLCKMTTAEYRPNNDTTTSGRKRMIPFDSMTNDKLMLSVIAPIHMPKNKEANKSHSINLVILMNNVL